MPRCWRSICRGWNESSGPTGPIDSAGLVHAHVFECAQGALECFAIFWRMQINAGGRLHDIDHDIPRDRKLAGDKQRTRSQMRSAMRERQ